MEEYIMGGEFLVPALAFVTMTLAIVFALWSKHRTEKRMADNPRPKSSLAKDGPGPQPFR
ncbi:hypothetical protein [Yoonia sp. R2-816]|uniref:hypothetical protein n=2 Tax=unclassified Yoonia TaxID=2629118 RepID=UPI00372D022E